MSLKDKIRLFVPPIYYKVKKRLFPKKQPNHHPLPKVEHEKNRMVVIGTGPSLNKTMKLYGERLKDYDCLMVNFSARTSVFELIKPKYYIMADPGFITEDSIRESINGLVSDLCCKTTWSMFVILPDSLKSWDGCAKLAEVENINLLFYNNHCANVPSGKLFEAWDKNSIAPPAQTVLNTAIWLSIYLGYVETYLVGADTSFIKDIYVGQKDNILYTIDTHFYDNQAVCPDEIEPERGGRKFGMNMEQILDAVHIMFQSYYQLQKYAEWKGVKIFNASEYSMIDCFERKKIIE